MDDWAVRRWIAAAEFDVDAAAADAAPLYVYVTADLCVDNVARQNLVDAEIVSSFERWSRR